MPEDLGGGEGGLNPLDARERKRRSRAQGVQGLRTWAEKRTGSARLMRGNGKKRSRVRRGSMSEGLGGEEDGFSLPDARERGKTFAWERLRCFTEFGGGKGGHGKEVVRWAE